MNNKNLRVAGTAALLGGTLFFLDFTLVGWLFRSGNLSGVEEPARLLRAILWFVTSLLLVGAPVGLLMANAVGLGWRKRVALIGTLLASLGAMSYIAGTIFVYNFPDRPTRQIFTPLGSALLTLGMALVSVAVMTAREWSGWRRFVPLMAALYFPL